MENSTNNRIERYQAAVGTAVMVILAVVAGIGWVEGMRHRAARDRDLAALSDLLGKQIEALQDQRAIMAEALRIEHEPAPRISTPQPFATESGEAVLRLAAENSGGLARDARLRAAVLCCGPLASLRVSPDRVFLVPSESSEVRPRLAAGDSVSHQIVLSQPDHPVRRSVREQATNAVWVWVALSYFEPLSSDDGAPVERLLDASFQWDSRTWRWNLVDRAQHRLIREILEHRGFVSVD